MSGRTTINIAGYTVDDNVSLSDDLFNISAGATLALLGFDALNDDAVSGSGRVSVEGSTTSDDSLLLSGATLFANLDALTQNGATVDLGQSSSDTVLARNVAGATWTLDNGAGITGAGSSEFVNFGLLEVTDSDSTVDANFYDRGGTIEVNGSLDFASPGDVNRFVNDKIEGAGTLEVDDLGVLDGSSVSTLYTNLADARIVGSVHVSSQFVDVGYLNLVAGSVLTLTNSAAEFNFAGEIAGGGTIAIRGDDSGAVGLSLVGDVTFANYGNVTFEDTELSAKPWAGDTVTIENEAGATWTESGYGQSSFSLSSGPGNAVFVNNGTFVEEAAGGANFDMAVVNNGVIEAGTPSQPDYYEPGNVYFVLSSVTGTGTIDIGADQVAVASVGSGQTLNFDASLAGAETPALYISEPSDFAGTVSGFDLGATNDQFVVNTATWTYQDFVPNSGNTGGSLMLSNGSAETAINLTGAYTAADFHAAVAGSLTTITYG
jgi:hypothetical protein